LLLDGLPRVVNARIQFGALPSESLGQQETEGRQGTGNS